MNKFFSLILFIYFSFNGGCKYRNHNSDIDSERNLHVQILQNQTLAPQLSSFLNRKLNDQIIKRGSFNIVSQQKESDFILKVYLRDYSKKSEIYDSKDTIIAAGFRMKINAIVSLTRRGSEGLIVDSIITETASVLRRDSLTKPLDRQALVSLSDSLASQIARLIETPEW